MKTTTFEKQATVALLAIMQHSVDHDLSVPMSIDVASRDQSIRLRVATGHAEWIRSLVVDAEDNEDGQLPGFVRTSWQVRLPETGVRFDLVTYREFPALLKVGGA
jgi:hypothetical protein